MTLTIDLTPDIEEALQEQATQSGQNAAEYATALLAAQVMARKLQSLKNRPVPQSLAELKPRRQLPSGSTPLAEVLGKWPGEETNEEIRQALEDLS